VATTAQTREREEALAKIFLAIARNARRQGLLDGVAAACRRIFGLEEAETQTILKDRGPRGLLSLLPELALDKWGERWRENMRPVFADLVSAYDRESGKRLGTGLAFDLENPFIQEWLDRMSIRLAGQVPETTRQHVEREVKEGISSGESVDDISRRIRGVFNSAKRSRADLIARSEANGSQNAASFLQAKASGVVVSKTWLTARDARVRDEHEALEGMTIPLDDEFPNGEGRWPSAPNCRCTLTFGVNL
jgi:SPP1 gp7 family putative phage head morphogenesis protein